MADKENKLDSQNERKNVQEKTAQNTEKGVDENLETAPEEISEEPEETDGEQADGDESAGDVRRRPYANYVIDDPEDMDEAPDTGDMFDDDELYDEEDDDFYLENKSGRRRGRAGKRVRTGISGGTLIFLWIVFLVLAGAYVYLFYINKNIIAEDTAGRDNTVVLDIPEGANYSLCGIDEINQLVNNYLLARTNVDQATLKKLVTDETEFDDMRVVETAAEYITAYNRTTCYMTAGYIDDSYIIYELSNLTIKDVDSSPLDIRSLYVTKQSDGSYKINNSELSDEESAYINEVTASEDIQDIYRHVKENNDYLLRTDTTFKEFYDMLD